ncbi:MAG: hypothetical protein GY906_39390, partial [bacterium]|nr:hypothetical protein [bacterium]
GTIKVYVHAVAKFARHFGQSPDTLSGEDVRAYFVHLLDRGIVRCPRFDGHSNCLILSVRIKRGRSVSCRGSRLFGSVESTVRI